MMKVRWLLALVVLSLLASLALTACQKATPAPAPPKPAAAPTPAATPAPAKPAAITWKIATSWTAALEVQREAEYFTKKVNDLSGGRLVLDGPYVAGTLVGAFELFDAVSKGSIEVGHSSPTYWVGKTPATSLFSSMPMGMKEKEYWLWLYQFGGIDLWRELYAQYNLMPFNAGIYGAEVGGHLKKPISNLEDLKKMKLRATGLEMETLKRLGIDAMPLPGGEIYPSLERGVIDGAVASIPLIDWQLKLHEVTSYLLVPGWNTPSQVFEIFVNLDQWKKLPADLKLLFEAAANDAALHFWVSMEAKNADYWKKFLDYGNKVIRLPKADVAKFEQVARQIEDEYAAKDPFFKRVIDSQRNFLKLQRAYEEAVKFE